MQKNPVNKIYFKIGAVLILVSPVWAFLIYGGLGKLFCDPKTSTESYYPCVTENLFLTIGLIIGTIILGGLLMYLPYRK